ncbi:MAG: class I SAM-dependent methyltransferase [Proteobacteria bacterium]|nr:class I SAM-dependent methyltransferase [Pseudomonadota bacterium]
MDIVSSEIEDYCRAHTTDLHPVYDELAKVTYAETECPQMQVGKLEGRFLKLLAQLTGAQRAIEVGTFTGFSALSMAEGMTEDGQLITLDINEESGRIAQAHFDMAPWGSRIERRIGPAIETLAALSGPFDLAFVDADKSGYIAYWDAIVPMLRPGGVIVVDNTLWSGRVLAPESDSDRAIVAFNAHAAKDPRVEHVLLTVRDGMMVARVR